MRTGNVDYHFNLLPQNFNVNSPEINGGGWWEWNREENEVTLYGSSSDYGPVKKQDLLVVLEKNEVCHQWQEGTKFYYSQERELHKALENRILIHSN